MMSFDELTNFSDNYPQVVRE